jgi:hypothetical protein
MAAALSASILTTLIFLETSQNRILVHTRDAVYFVANTLDRWRNALQSAGQSFEMVDRSYLADLSKAARMDDKWSRLVFEDGEHAQIKYWNVALASFHQIAATIESLQQDGNPPYK